MSTIMDTGYSIDVDDLFGDSEQVNLQAMTAPPPLKGLPGRIDELGASGCCQKVAWSKNGCVAYVGPDGYSVNFRIFSRDIATGKWDLRRDVPLAIPQARDDYPIVHLSWSHLGNDLVVVDAAGRVMIFSCAMALDRMHFSRADLAHPEAEVDGVVGIHWLAINPYDAKKHIIWSTTREGSAWNWDNHVQVCHDPSHPIEGKACLIYLKKHGELKLRFQQNDNTWQEVSTQLGPINSTEETFTHAAFASNNDKILLLAAYDVARRLLVYRIETTWNVPPEKKNPSAGHIDKPVLHISLITVEENCSPVDTVSTELTNGAETGGSIASQLTQLNFMPATPEKDNASLPTIQAIFCRPPNLVNFDPLQAQDPQHSVIVRWEVQETQQAQLHPSLDQVTSKKKRIDSVADKSVLLLKRQQDFPLASVAIAFYPLCYNVFLAFCYSDGTIEMRRRSTLELVLPDGNPDTITSLLQAGFAFAQTEPSLHVAFSPNHCVAVCMQLDGDIKLRSMEYQHGDLSTDEDNDPRHTAALAAVVLQSASAANQYCSSDDILSIIGPLSPERIHTFANLMFEGLNVNPDIGIEEPNNNIPNLGRSPGFAKTLSALNLLGLRSTSDRSFISKLAWLTINVKFVSQVFSLLQRMNIGKEPLLRPEFVPQSMGLVRWILHFIAYFLDELFSIGRAVEDMSLTKDSLTQKMLELNKPAVLLLLSGFPRMMMKSYLPPLLWVKRSADISAATTPTTPPPSPEIRKLYAPLAAAFDDLPFQWRLFDRLIADVHLQVRTAYKHANLSDKQRNLAERDLLLGRIPDVLFPVAKCIVTDMLFSSDYPNGCLADNLDMGHLTFFDTKWLGFTESKRSAAWHATHVVDVCQKMIIRGLGAQSHPVTGTASTVEVPRKKNGMRVCIRCGSYMEDIVQGIEGYSSHHVAWSMSVSKHCICGSSWMLAEEKPRAK